MYPPDLPGAVKNTRMKSCLVIIAVLMLVNSNSFSQNWAYRDTCTFESFPFPLVIDSTVNNIWQIGQPSKVFFDEAYSIPYGIITDTINTYPINCNSCFTIILDQEKNPWIYAYSTIRFKHKFDTDSLFDGGYLEISYDNGTTWQNVIDDSISTTYPTSYFMEIRYNDFYSSDDTLSQGVPAFSGRSNGWIESSVEYENLGVKKSVPDTVLIRFCFVSDQNDNSNEGWMIDDIALEVYIPSKVENTEINQIIICPNPLVNQSTIQYLGNTKIVGLRVFDMSGKAILFKDVEIDQIVLKRGDFTPGTYLIQVITTDNIISSKLIVE